MMVHNLHNLAEKHHHSITMH